MQSSIFTYIFVAALLAMVAAKLWLATRQIDHVGAHRDKVPDGFADSISLSSHQRAADYTVTLMRLKRWEIAVGAVLLFVLTIGGGVRALDGWLAAWLGGGMLQQIALIAAVLLISGLVDLPFDLLRHFRIESSFGFNRMTPALFLGDLAKGLAVGVVLGLPLIAAVLALMHRVPQLWWLLAWFVWIAFNALVLVLYPTLIAPLFNRFEPLHDDVLRRRVEALLGRCGFAAKGLFVMDGSRRSAHGNAYFTGFGAAKRIVFFDTLLSRLNGDEIEAVLAHELGHFKHRHLSKRLVFTFCLSLLLLALLGWLADQSWFYSGLGAISYGGPRDYGVALILFFLVIPVFSFFVSPLASMSSRRHEFQADAFAASQARSEDLVNALVKLYQDNASTLTPDPLYSAVYSSHPPASQRIERLLSLR